MSRTRQEQSSTCTGISRLRSTDTQRNSLHTIAKRAYRISGIVQGTVSVLASSTQRCDTEIQGLVAVNLFPTTGTNRRLGAENIGSSMLENPSRMLLP